MPPDPKPPKRIRDPDLMRAMHLEGGGCVLADDTCVPTISLHHILKHPRDDVRANLVKLCGSGTTGHHGLITNEDAETKRRLGAYLTLYRSDTMEYLAAKLGGADALMEWARRNGYLQLPQ